MRSPALSALVAVSLLVVMANVRADSVTQKNGIVVRGEIEREDDRGVLIRLDNGREILIAPEDIASMDAGFGPAFEKGNDALHSGEHDEAVRQYRRALGDEKRTWAKYRIQAMLVAVQLEKGDLAGSAKTFDEIPLIAEDSARLAAAPLLWSRVALREEDVQQARQWILRSDPLQRLVAASWLIESSNEKDREKAQDALTALRSDSNAKIAALAQAESWRGTDSTEPASVRLLAIESLPSSLRGGANMAHAAAYEKEGKFADAALAASQAGLVDPGRPTQQATALVMAAEYAGEAGLATDRKKLLELTAKKYPKTEPGKAAAAQLTTQE